MAQIYRYSNFGFEPQYQSHLFSKSQTTLQKLQSFCINDYQKSLISLSFRQADSDFEYSGIFVFIKEPTISDRDYYLNHLNKILDINNIKYSVANINENCICYLDDGFVYLKENKTTIKEAITAGHTTIYIPESELKSII